MITKLELTNFQKHQHLEVEFGSGLNLIVGDNWAGKTTVLRALQFALLGTAAIDVKAPEIPTNGSNSFSTVLHFRADGLDYLLNRSKTTASLKLKDTGKLVASGHTGVTKEVEEIFGTSSKNFGLLNCVRQGEADQLLLMNASQINALLNEVTGIGLITDVLTYAKNKVTQLGWSEQAKASWENTVRERESALRIAQEVLTNAQGWMDTYTPQFEEIKQKKDQLYQNLRSLENAYQESGSKREKALRLEGSLQQLRDSPAAQPGDRPDYAYHEELRVALSRIDTTKEATTNLKARKKLLEADLRGAESSVKVLESELEQYGPEQPCLELETELQELEGKILQTGQRLEHLLKQKRDSVCDVCGSVLQDIDQDDLADRIASLQEAGEWLSACKKTKAEELASAKEHNRLRSLKEGSLQQWRQTCHNVGDQLLRLIDQISELGYDKDKHDEAKAKFSEVDNQITNYNNALKAYNTYVENCETLEKQLAQLRQVDSGPSMEEVVAARHLYDNQCAGYQSWDEVFTKQRLGLEKAQTEARMLATSLESDRAQFATASREFLNHDSWKRLSRFLTVNRDRYLLDIWESVLGYASRFASEATSGKITRIQRTTGGKFSYIEDGYERPIAQASGLQKAIIGLSIKLAMGLALGSGRRLLILDEVTAAAKDENSLLISQLLAGYGGQVIMVTHRPEDTAVADHVISV